MLWPCTRCTESVSVDRSPGVISDKKMTPLSLHVSHTAGISVSIDAALTPPLAVTRAGLVST